jgi:hypothetical protein
MIQMDDDPVKFTILSGWQKKAPVENNAVRRDRGAAVGRNNQNRAAGGVVDPVASSSLPKNKRR